jgi:hypothetical protein
MTKDADLQPPDLARWTGRPLWSTAPSTVSNSSGASIVETAISALRVEANHTLQDVSYNNLFFFFLFCFSFASADKIEILRMSG